RRVAEAIARQAATVEYVAPGFATEPRAQLSEQLLRVLPRGLTRFFFSTSGTEANEAAIRIARAATGRRTILALSRSYHGATSAALSVSGDLRRDVAGAAARVDGTRFVPECYCYRCPLQLSYPSCGVACADEVGTAIDADPDVAAMILEPVIGTNGVIVPVPEYLPKVRAITKERGVLLITDEVMTGWGRTGAWFGSQRFGIEPDLLTTAKGITGGYVPLALTATTAAVHGAFLDRMLPVGHTFEAHPVALAAAVAAIGEYERLDLIQRARSEEAHFLERLAEVGARHPSVGETRGVGLFAAVELVQDRERRLPFNTPGEKVTGRPTVAQEVADAMARDGVYAFAWVNHLVLAPPLIVRPDEVDRGFAALDRALEVSDARVDGATTDRPNGTGQI
ncbi:MAG TPA: aminotransferase class III-fold pyridoxal phosphate-dependent enzyme, partial [Thermoplasmata archaeon]|nr:aminotransferase class III-fold pyridoxal phosphate-dependent enzyme [Thermoplasmata archaeon]